MYQVQLSKPNFTGLKKIAKGNRRSTSKEADIAVEQYLAATAAKIEKDFNKQAGK